MSRCALCGRRKIPLWKQTRELTVKIWLGVELYLYLIARWRRRRRLRRDV